MSDAVRWQKFRDAAAKATWAYLATTSGDQPKVRVVHPAFEGERVWIATGQTSAKAAQIGKIPRLSFSTRSVPSSFI